VRIYKVTLQSSMKFDIFDLSARLQVAYIILNWEHFRINFQRKQSWYVKRVIMS